jgi:hypothetical protein
MLGVSAGEADNVGYCRAYSRVYIHWLCNAVTGHGGDARDQWFVMLDPVMDRGSGADILHEASNIRWQPASGYFPIGHELYELIFATRRINGRYLFQNQSHIAKLAHRLAEPANRLGLIAFNDDICNFELQSLQQYLGAADDFTRMLTHEYIVATDVRFALDTVEYQVVQFAGNCLHEFLCCRIYGATEPDDATLQDPGQQLIR